MVGMQVGKDDIVGLLRGQPGSLIESLLDQLGRQAGVHQDRGVLILNQRRRGVRETLFVRFVPEAITA